MRRLTDAVTWPAASQARSMGPTKDERKFAHFRSSPSRDHHLGKKVKEKIYPGRADIFLTFFPVRRQPKAASVGQDARNTHMTLGCGTPLPAADGGRRRQRPRRTRVVTVESILETQVPVTQLKKTSEEIVPGVSRAFLRFLPV